jgi:hypothetical protein
MLYSLFHYDINYLQSGWRMLYKFCSALIFMNDLAIRAWEAVVYANSEFRTRIARAQNLQGSDRVEGELIKAILSYPRDLTCGFGTTTDNYPRA